MRGEGRGYSGGGGKRGREGRGGGVGLTLF